MRNTWNHRNELTESTKAGITTSYTYDHTGQRVSKTTGTNTTLYPFSNYELKNGNITKHIYTNHTLVATIEADTPAPKTYYNHQDHLNSTTKVTDQTGYLNQLLNYQPYGGTRIDNKYDTINQTKRYTGHDYDEETSLSYMGARYQSGDTGRFTSQDPVSLALGDWKTVQDKTNNKLGYYLKSPQSQNTYSYTANNPIKYVDEGGEFFWFAAAPLVIYAPEIIAASIAITNSALLSSSVGDSVATLADPNASVGEKAFVVGMSMSGGKVVKNVTTGSLRTASNVSISQSRKNHVLNRHTIGGSEFSLGKDSYFNNADEITSLIKSVNGQKGVLQKNGNIVRSVELDRSIGYDAVSGKGTNVVTVVTRKNGDLVTAHPGKPRYNNKEK
ncbi:MAG: RHS repeat-associated core domain-containing protein [Candidatus Paceibacterota bacterium]